MAGADRRTRGRGHGARDPAFEFFAAVVYSDCFLTCTGAPDHALGIALALLSATTLTCVPLIGAVLWRSRRAYIGTGWFGVVAAAAAVLGLG